MNERPEIRLDKAQFLRWVQDQEGRFELKGGRAVMQARVTKNHARIAAAFVHALSTRLDTDSWLVGTADLAVEIGEDVRFPDVIVERWERDGNSLSSLRPVILVEVLSPSSGARDFVEKLAEYTSLPTLEAYIVASQDEPICWLWQRDQAGAFPRLPEEVKGRDGVIALAGRGVSLPLAEVFRGIGV